MNMTSVYYHIFNITNQQEIKKDKQTEKKNSTQSYLQHAQTEKKGGKKTISKRVSLDTI